jgi:hypothetical protein
MVGFGSYCKFFVLPLGFLKVPKLFLSIENNCIPRVIPLRSECRTYFGLKIFV